MIKIVLLSLALLLGACASSTKQTDAFLQKAHSLPSSHQIEGVPFVQQEIGHCGPATLTMAMNWAGKEISVQTLAPQVYTPGMQGSLQVDMISASRRNGMLAIPLTGLENLLTEVAAGHPVIVFENLALSWAPTWHYAIVFGYDLQNQTVLMHSGPEAFKKWDIRKFERSWKLGDYWGLVILPPNQLSVTANEQDNLKAAIGLEQAGRMEEAALAYRSLLQKWPDNLGALIGLGTWAFEKKNYAEAVSYLRKATDSHPTSAAAWHNLALAEAALKLKKNAKKSAQRAVELAPSSTRSQYQESLKELL